MFKKLTFLTVLLLVAGYIFVASPVKVHASTGAPQCSDGIDNDGDTLIDYNDPECHNGGVVTADTYLPSNETENAFGGVCITCGGPTITTGGGGGGGGSSWVCSDFSDNDGDGLIDWNDPGCHTDGDINNLATYDRYDNDEKNVVVTPPPAPVPAVLGVTQVACGVSTGRPCTLQKTGGIVSDTRTLLNRKANKVADEEKNSLFISKLGVNKPILQLPTINSLFREAMILPWTSTPDKGGNTVLVGHAYYLKNGVYSKSTFYELDTMKAGDEITMNWKGKSYTYVVTEMKKVKPTDITVEDQTANPTLTIYSCGRFTNTMRTVVVATLKA